MIETMKKLIALLMSLALLCAGASGLAESGVDYADLSNWVYAEADEEPIGADVFFIAPTATTGDEENLYWADFADEKYLGKFVGAVEMQKNLYDHYERFFAPLYHEAFLTGYYSDDADAYLDAAYEDVRAAFQYYLDNFDAGRPIVLAGFSQGSDMCVRLLKEFFADEALNDRLVACYAIGWRVTDEELAEYPHLHCAEAETDTGVIVAFTGEADFITGSLILPEGMKTHSINPLNWATDGTMADKSFNKGACFLNTDGSVMSEVPELTGAYIDEARGSLKVTDVTPEEYPARLKDFEDGVYHCYDYQFFYRNIEQNVQDRIGRWMVRH